MFHVIEKELEWRRQRGGLQGFESLDNFKPLVAMGVEGPLHDQVMMADYFRMTCYLYPRCVHGSYHFTLQMV